MKIQIRLFAERGDLFNEGTFDALWATNTVEGMAILFGMIEEAFQATEGKRIWFVVRDECGVHLGSETLSRGCTSTKEGTSAVIAFIRSAIQNAKETT